MNQTIEHGGALDRAIARFGGTRSDWLDLSTGINPEAFPLPSFTLDVWNRLPDESLLVETLVAARTYYRVESHAPVVAAPGTQALIQLLPQLIPAGKVAILSPTYQEHAASFAQAGWSVAECSSIDAIPHDAKIAVVVNPNNPDGRVIPQAKLLALAEELGTRGGFLIVDEAFADSHPHVSVAAMADKAPLVVLKSFGKFFGLAGIRLGFAFASAAICIQLKMRLGPWAVSGPAFAIARHAFGNDDLRKMFGERIRQRRRQLSEALATAGVKEAGGTDLFALVEIDNAIAVYEWLCQHHILVRKFDYAPSWLRIGLAPDDIALTRLTTCLKSLKI